jgi:hypothetical protein
MGRLFVECSSKTWFTNDIRDSPVITVFQQDSQTGFLGEVASHANSKFSMKWGITSGFAKVRFNMLAAKNRSRD